MLVNAYRDFLAQATLGEAVTSFNNANAFIGVGDSSTAVTVTQTDLQAATNKLRKGQDATYPQRAANVLTFRSTFGSAEANFAWLEWGIFNASSGGVMLNRKVESLGTKTTGTWTITCTITLGV
jgi:hypothetical protein